MCFVLFYRMDKFIFFLFFILGEFSFFVYFLIEKLIENSEIFFFISNVEIFLLYRKRVGL